MSTDMIVKDRPDFLPAAPQTSGSVMAEFLDGLGGSVVDMPVLSTRGKEFRLRRDGQEASLKTQMLDVILVGSRGNNSRRFYEGQYVRGETRAPTCASADGIRPDDNVEDKQSELCANCPRNVWGSKRSASGGKGKECDDYRRVLVFIPSKNILKPVVLDIAATSLRKRKGETGPEMQLREYLRALARHGIEPYQCVTSLGFTDDEYPRLVFSFARWVGKEEHAAVLSCRESDEFAAALEHREEEQAIVELPVSPEAVGPEPQAKEEAPKPKPKPKPKPAPEPEPEVQEEAPEQEDAPAAPAGDDDDLSDLMALLDD